ncbi:unnamed protein product, partial [Ectocarpus fasciculatus]
MAYVGCLYNLKPLSREFRTCVIRRCPRLMRILGATTPQVSTNDALCSTHTAPTQATGLLACLPPVDDVVSGSRHQDKTKPDSIADRRPFAVSSKCERQQISFC